jgi:hypothetical protein
MAADLKPTKANEFTLNDNKVGIMVGFSRDEMELIQYYCPKGKSYPTWIRSIILTEIGVIKEDSGGKKDL